MSVTEYLVTILSSAAVSASLTATLFWLLKNWISERLKNAIKHEYDLKLESHKAQLLASFNTEIESHKAMLQVENAMATESLRANLHIAASERQIRFARLHEKVAECVAELYLLLSNLSTTVERYTAILETPTMGTQEERRKAFAAALKEFDDYFKMHKLYVPKVLAALIKAYVNKLYDLAKRFKTGVEDSGDERPGHGNTWVLVHEEMQTEARPLFEGLEDEFRGLLGVPVSTAT